MFNKDQYDQEEYNDYYQQEVQGAELGNSTKKGGLASKLIILLILLAISIAGYFGYKALSTLPISEHNTKDIDTPLQVSEKSSLPQSIQKEVVVEKEVKKEHVETKVITEVSKVLDSKSKMSQEEIANVVQAVIQQLNQKKDENNASLATSKSTKEDVAFIDELSGSEVDSVSANLIKELENIDINTNTEVNNAKEKIDVYNKVNVQNVSGTDTLSALSEQITAVMNEGNNQNKEKNYTKSLRNEVDVRKNEMRIIIVRQGDTLGRIAKRAYGNVMDYKKIYQANPDLTRPDRIYVGQKLRIPN